jgi:hypothetical protein
LCLRLVLFWLLSLHSLLLLLLLFFRFFCHSCIGFHDLQFSSFASRKFRNYYFPQARLFAAHQTQSPAPAPAPAPAYTQQTQPARARALLLKSQAEAAAAINPNSTKFAQTNKTQQQKRRKMGGDAQAGVVFFFHNFAMGTASAHEIRT